MEAGELNLKTLPLVGFEFLGAFWISINVDKKKVRSAKKVESKKEDKIIQWWQKEYKEYDEVEEDRNDDPPFTVLIHPENLDKTELIWRIALESEIPEVYSKSILFLVYSHMALDECMDE